MTKQAKSEPELRQVFQSKADCYADTGRFENDGGYTEGEVIQAMTEDRFAEVVIPIINQQAEENEKLNGFLSVYQKAFKELSAEVQRKKDGVMAEIRAHNKTKEEIEKLKAEIAEIERGYADAMNTAIGHAKTVVALQSRFDELEHEYKNFHRNLCKRFDYYHDNVEWRGYLASLEEHIAKKLDRFDELVKSLEDSIDKEVDDPLGDEKHLLVRYVDIQSLISKAKGTT